MAAVCTIIYSMIYARRMKYKRIEELLDKIDEGQKKEDEEIFSSSIHKAQKGNIQG